MSLEGLASISRRIAQERGDLDNLLQLRDAMVVKELQEGTSPAAIAEVLGVTRQYVWELGRKAK